MCVCVCECELYATLCLTVCVCVWSFAWAAAAFKVSRSEAKQKQKEKQAQAGSKKFHFLEKLIKVCAFARCRLSHTQPYSPYMCVYVCVRTAHFYVPTASAAQCLPLSRSLPSCSPLALPYTFLQDATMGLPEPRSFKAGRFLFQEELSIRRLRSPTPTPTPSPTIPSPVRSRSRSRSLCLPGIGQDRAVNETIAKWSFSPTCQSCDCEAVTVTDDAVTATKFSTSKIYSIIINDLVTISLNI